MMMDIAIALLLALLLEMFSLINKYFKSIAILTCCVTFIVIYCVSGWQIDFKGQMDLTIWILCIVGFDTLLAIGIDMLSDHIKE